MTDDHAASAPSAHVARVDRHCRRDAFVYRREFVPLLRARCLFLLRPTIAGDELEGLLVIVFDAPLISMLLRLRRQAPLLDSTPECELEELAQVNCRSIRASLEVAVSSAWSDAAFCV